MPVDVPALLDLAPLWDFSDVEASRVAFEARRVKLQAALASGTLSPELRRQVDLARLELLTQLARTHSLEGDVDAADARLARVADDLPEPLPEPLPADLARVRVRYLLEHGRTRRTAKEPEVARTAFVSAWEVARAQPAGLDGLAVDAAHMVAICDAGTEGELEWGHRALELAESSTEPAARKWRPTLLNNLGWAAFERGQLDVALERMERQVALRREAGKEPALRIALWSRARVLRELGRVEEALAAQTSLLETYGEDARSDGFVHEEMAECLHALGRTADAAPWFASAHALLSETWLADAEPARLARLAELGAAASP